MQDIVTPSKNENISRQNKKRREQMGRTPYQMMKFVLVFAEQVANAANF